MKNSLLNRRYLLDLVRLIALVVFVSAIWCFVYKRFSPARFAEPIIYAGGDETWIYATVKAVAEGEVGLFGTKEVRGLGAPFRANWNDFPATEDFIYYATALVARLVGLSAAINLAYLGAIILAAASFYFVARYLRWAWAWSFAGAVLFAWSFYMGHRSTPHFNLIFYWPCPFWLLICWWTAGRRGIPFGSPRFWFSCVVVFFTAWNNPYYTNFFLQLLGLAILARLVRGYPKKTLWPAFTLAALAAALSLTTLADTFAYQIRHGWNHDAASRQLADLELYSLRPVDLFLPFSHRLQPLESFVRSYAARTLIRGEIALTYIGVVGAVSLLCMWGGTLIKLLRRGAQRLDGLSLQTLWLVAYSACGSLGIIPGLFGFYFFRGMNRVSIVILALALFAFVRWASRATRTWSPLPRAGLAALVICLGLWDQTPIYGPAESRNFAERMENDRRFVAQIETKLPVGAMIFQLPVTRSQEAEPVRTMRVYDQFRPYIASRTLHFSHGDDFGRAPERWREMLSALSVPEMVKQLERHGFSGVLIDRDAFPNHAADLLAAFANAGKPSETDNPHDTFDFIRLVAANPPAQPNLPSTFLSGWYSPEQNEVDVWRWAERDAALEVYRPNNRAPKTVLTFDLESPEPRTIELSKFGKLNREVTLTAREDRKRVRMTIDWPADHDRITIKFHSREPAGFQQTDHRLTAFRIINLSEDPSPFPD